MQLSRARPEPAPPPEAPTLFDDADRQEAIEEVLAAMLAEPEAGFQPVSVLYQDFLVRCRIAKVASPPDLPAFRQRLALARAGVGDPAVAEGEWEQATLVAASLPEDIRGVFLLIARAALTKAPCPSDGEIAKAYGTRSPGRARRLLAYMEERGFLLAATDLRGNRIVSLPDLGWQTAPGSPEAIAAE